MSTFDGLNKVFGEEPTELEQHVEKTKSLRTDTPDIQQDYETSRAQLHSLVMKGQEAVDGKPVSYTHLTLPTSDLV